MKSLDAQMVQQPPLHLDSVADGDGGEGGGIGPTVAGLTELGPVVPRHPPRMLEQITKKRSVSIALPGPTTISHQPGKSAGSCRATCESPLRAWQISTALLLAGVQRAVVS